MRALLQDVRTGHIATYDVPPPEILPRHVLVRTAFSAISAGTEKATVELGRKSLTGKALARPDLVRQVAEYARSHGIRAAWDNIQARLSSLSTLGYSSSGYVVEAGPETGYLPGDRVACAGAGYANHCEVNCVPQNLVVRVPDSVALDAAALTTLGAIAMQGIRQAEVSLGEIVAVIGAGLVGVLTIQILRAAGCRVVAVDLLPDRAARAVSLGAHLGLTFNEPELESRAAAFSGPGFDAVLITAATLSAEPLELAAKLLRDRGRVVVVGDVGMGVSRRNMYRKEITLRMSRSYGPGRYDPLYEEQGQDYPIGYVRWTERRNMAAFLDLLSTGAVRVDELLSHRYGVEDGDRAYADLESGSYTGIIDYHVSAGEAVTAQTFPNHVVRPRPVDKLRIGCMGAGGFARGVILPFLRRHPEVILESVASKSGVAAESTRQAFRFPAAEAPSDLLLNPNVDAAFIVTHHDSHAGYVIRALKQGKAVFVEKPLAVNRAQMDELATVHAELAANGRNPFLMVGFNRRFAPLTAKLSDFFRGCTEPMLIHIRCNAGFIPRSSWIQNEAGGGRIVGEVCHFVDWARAVTGSPIHTVTGVTVLPDSGRYNADNLVVTLVFEDSSIANLVYTANGDSRGGKEYIEVSCEGRFARLDDFKTLRLTRAGKTKTLRGRQDKGHRRELELTIEAMLRGNPPPIAFEELRDVTETTFLIEEAVRSGGRVPTSAGNQPSEAPQARESAEGQLRPRFHG